MVWGLVDYGCRLADLAHGFDVGHFVLYIRKLSKTGVTKNVVFGVIGPTPKMLIFFSSLYQCWLNCLKIFFGVTPRYRTTFNV